jgi:glucose/mannose-6-phosphate isomerase
MGDTSLDDGALYDRQDPQRLRDRIAGLPEQIAEAWDAAQGLTLPPEHARCEDVAVLGMGGSGIGASLLQAMAVDLGGEAPVTVVRGYTLPAYVGERTLVLASSNSGDTEEVVASFEEALRRGAPCVAITSGGRLRALAEGRGVPVLNVAWEHEPRAAVGWSFAALLAICGRANLLPDQSDALPGALDAIRALTAELQPDRAEASNLAKQLARRLHGRLAVIVGAESLAPIAYRWRTQINENAKSWAVADELPEMNHNAQAGFGLPKRVVPLLHVVLLRHASMHPRNRLRVEGTLAEMQASGVSAEAIDVNGETLLAQVLRGLVLGDWVSYYLGILNGVEPSPVEALGRLKDWLASR